MGRSTVVINHRIAAPGSAARRAVGGSRLLYISNRPGAVCEPTEDDLRIKAENALMSELGYIAFRPGSVAGMGAGHALFDQTGVPDRAAVARELSDTEGAVITSVVSVRRDDAEALGLSTRQGWERLLRARWADTVSEMGIMERKDVRWCVAVHFHPDGVNVHAHVFTWDASGNFEGLLPKRRMLEADEALASFALRPRQEELNLARTQARDELVTGLKSAVITQEDARALIKELPEEGSLKYASLVKRAPSAARAADHCVDSALDADPELRKALERWRRAVLEHARLKSFSGPSLESHLSAAESDLRARLGNAAISNVRRSCKRLEPPRAPLRKAVENEGLRIQNQPCKTDVPQGAIPAKRARKPEAPEYAPPPTLRETERERSLSEETASFLGPVERTRLARSLAAGKDPDSALVMAVPSLRAAAARARVPAPAVAGMVGSAARSVRALASASLDRGHSDAGDEMGREAMSLLARSMRVALNALAKRGASALSAKNNAVFKAAERTLVS